MRASAGTGAFLAWAVVGAGLCVAVLGALSIGIFVLPAAVAAAVALLVAVGVALFVWLRARPGGAGQAATLPAAQRPG